MILSAKPNWQLMSAEKISFRFEDTVSFILDHEYARIEYVRPAIR